MKLTPEQEQRERDAALMSRDEVADKLFPIHEQFLERKNFREGFTRGWLARATIAYEREERLNKTLINVSAFLRNWMPIERGPMMAQFNKMLDEVDAALLSHRNDAVLAKESSDAKL